MMSVNRLCVSLAWLGLFLSLLANPAGAETVFVEAESMHASPYGWMPKKLI